MKSSLNSNKENNYNSSKSNSSSSDDSSKRTISYEAPSHSFSNKDCTISEGNKTAKEISGNIVKIEEVKVLDSGAKSVKQEESMLFTSESESVRMYSSGPQNECKSGANCKISLGSETKKSKGGSKYLSQRVYLPCSSYINVEENIKSNRLIKNIEDKEAHPDEEVKIRVQKSEKQVKIKSINKIFNNALYKLDSFVHKNNRYEYGTRVSENIYGSFRKENIIRSLGVYTYRDSSMFIFSLTKECKVVCEIYTKNFINDYGGEIVDLIRITDHLYFYEILESTEDDFNNAWIILKIGLAHYDFVDYGFMDNLKSITFTPFSPNEVIKGQFEEINLNTILVCLKELESWRPNINLIFKSFEFKDIFTLKRLLILINTHNIKLRKCKIHLTSDFRASTERNSDSKIYIDQCEICDENGSEAETLMDDLKNCLIESSFRQDMIFIRNNDCIPIKKCNIARSDDIEHCENRSVANSQIIAKQKKSNYSYKLFNLQQLISPYSLASLNNNLKEGSELSLDGVICIPDKPKTAYEDVQFIKNNMFAIISNLLILDEFTNYNYKLVRRRNYICIVESKKNKDTDEDGEFLCDKIEEERIRNFIFVISTGLEVPELHINCKISVYLFKLLLNILDKMKVKIYFIVDLDYLLNEENDFEETLKELNYRLNFKIYTESIVYKFRDSRNDKIANKELKLFNEVYAQMISNDCNILILNLKSLNSSLLDKLIKTNEDISVNFF